MEWQIALLLIFGGLLVLFALGLPVAFAFLFITMVGAVLLWGGVSGLQLLTLNIRSTISFFGLLPIPMFILMGEVMFQSGIGVHIIDAMDKWLGRLPGRLGLLTVVSGTLLSTLSGVTIATTALLGSTLTPEMERRGYKKPMSLGPVLGSGGLAMMIPPSSLAVLLAAIAQISIGQTLIAIIVPGLLMALFYASYIVLRCWLQPSLAPAYDVPTIPLSKKLKSTAMYILPLGGIIFLVMGVIFVGLATPTEAAAMGAFGTYILAFAYEGVKWGIIKKSIWGTVRLSVMILMIIATAQTFGQILVFSGVSRGLVEFVAALPFPRISILILMQVLVLFLGMFLESGSIIMITIPIFMPIVNALGFDPVWFGVIMLLNVEMGLTTPPFGLGLITMKGVAPPGTTMGDCYRGGIPFLVCDATVMALLIAFPPVALWLPGLMLRG